MKQELIDVANAIKNQKYPTAKVIFLAGSVVRGEGTRTSDLDIVVVFQRLPHAYRESYSFAGWPVEAFVHDPETLNYFFSKDVSSGIPSLPAMISEGIKIPQSNEFSRSLKNLANSVLEQGPQPWNAAEVDASRYAITALIDDLRDARSRSEQVATAVSLYGSLADHHLRTLGLWSARHKTIPRRLQKLDTVFAQKFDEAFETLFLEGKSDAVLAIAEDILAPSGGWLFENYLLAAPAEWRSGS